MKLYQLRCGPKGLSYIGSTTGPLRVRWNAHKRDLQKREHRNPQLQRAFSKYGTISFAQIEIVTPGQVTETVLRKIEAGLIRGLKEAGATLCNVALDTTAPMVGRKHSVEAIQRMKVAQQKRLAHERALGIKRSPNPETRALLSLASRNRRWTVEQRQAISARVSGTKHSVEARERMRQAQLVAKTHLGKPKSEKQRVAMSAVRKDKRLVWAFREGAAPQIFESMTQAARALRLNKGNISEASSKPGRQIKGWEFLALPGGSAIHQGSSK